MQTYDEAHVNGYRQVKRQDTHSVDASKSASQYAQQLRKHRQGQARSQGQHHAQDGSGAQAHAPGAAVAVSRARTEEVAGESSFSVSDGADLRQW